MDTNKEHERDHNFVIGLASSTTEAITAGDALQINRQMGGYASVYGCEWHKMLQELFMKLV